MKKNLIPLITVLLLGFLSALTMYAQAPDRFIYQAEARNSHGTVIRNANLEVMITILEGSINGIIVWEGTHEITTDKYGLFTLVIGEGTSSGYTFSAIDWANNTHFLNVKVTNRKGDWIDMGTVQFLSVPYALHARTAGNSFSGSYFDLWDAPTNLSSFFNDVGFLTIESDPIFTGHPAWGVTQANITNWSSAFSWGDHSTAGYIKNFTETDPVFIGHAANGITLVNISDWIEAHNWGDHSQVGYLTGFAETDPIFAQHPASAIEIDDVTDWNSAFGWGDHASAGYLTSYSELDPLFMGHVAHTITSANLTNWMEAFSWGNHAEAGFLTSEVDADPANELQSLTLEGNTLTLSNGGSVILPTGTSTGGQYFFADKDGDGFGYHFNPVYVPTGVSEPANFVLDPNDCNDENENINPDAIEIEDGIDNDCDNEVDETDETDNKSIDIIFVVDNSASMVMVMSSIQNNLNSFANNLSEINFDYRIILLSNYPIIHVPPPLGGSSGEPNINPPIFYHYSANVTHLWREILDSYNSSDEFGLAPNGMSEWLRQRTTKIFIAVSDDQSSEETAESFDSKLLMLSNLHFGTTENRRYIWYSIVDDNEGQEYQKLSDTTGGKYYSISEVQSALFSIIGDILDKLN